MITGFSVADYLVAYVGEGVSNSMRAWLLDPKKRSSKLLEDSSAKLLEGIELGEVRDWNYTHSRGETIYGRYYLPPHFDPSKKYPMIVNYYGGCSPTGRNFESRYPHHLYAAQGYVVYIVQPSGATGFGQEFAARHVNTWGQGGAEDIIEGVEKFCATHSFVDKDRIGCIGASFGGFMSQYLVMTTDIFAAAISHAGISDITSYWGEGYWGYSYCEVSTANNYPWQPKAQEMILGQSPLFNADKVNTPILFLHGMADTNVPVGESIQMFTALKLLGKDTAFVAVKDQDHHILQYDKRQKWQNTIFAWFAKYLQDDPSLWDAMYPPVEL
jgi:dipeptidyl aminopeptidase/acylaminoacyl peptidase